MTYLIVKIVNTACLRSMSWRCHALCTPFQPLAFLFFFTPSVEHDINLFTFFALPSFPHVLSFYFSFKLFFKARPFTVLHIVSLPGASVADRKGGKGSDWDSGKGKGGGHDAQNAPGF